MVDAAVMVKARIIKANLYNMMIFRKKQVCCFKRYQHLDVKGREEVYRKRREPGGSREISSRCLVYLVRFVVNLFYCGVSK
jgi:hypothetical protein